MSRALRGARGLRSWLVAAAGLLILGLAVLLLVRSLGNGSSRADAQRGWRPTKWLVAGISPDQRRLSLLFASGGCTRDRGRARVAESTTSVTIRVESNEVVESDGEVACTLDLLQGTASVRLKRPLAGRKILGASRRALPARLYAPTKRKGDRLVLLAPRLSGLRADDAIDFLHTHSFSVAPLPAEARTREVVATRPPQGTELRGSRPRVALVVGRPRD